MSKNISKKMLVNVVHPEEARVAIVHDGRLMELNIEITGKEQIKGNIYKGVVLRVEQSLQAAFVDIGRGKPGFLQMGELHPDFWQWRDDIPEEQRKKRPRIQEVLRRGQEILVQVEKDERDHKGAALTSYISLPGRYTVLMPGSDSKGISRKVEQESERKKLKEIVAGIEIPDGYGYIIRTEAVGRTPEEITKDFENLCSLYEEIKLQAAGISGAGEIYKDKGLIIRFIRDYFSDDIDEVIVDSKEAYKEAKEFFRDTMPKCEKRVKLHREKRPVFSRFQLEEQIDQIYEKRVPLPSGGYLIIEPTEALVSIDVNSGKTSGEKGIEETALKTNLEAVEEVARQLRLRDLGGLIVIDCIDMREKRHDIEVERTLKQALKMDKARVNVGRISEFGMLEMSRQRIAKTLNDAIHLECPHCEGRGKVKSAEALAVSFLRKVHAAAAKGTVAEVNGGLPLDVAYYLLNRKKRELAQIENDYDIQVTVKGKTSFLLNQIELEVVKREKIDSHEEVSETKEGGVADTVATPLLLTPAVVAETTVADAETPKKKRRRKKKKKLPAEQPIEQQVDAEIDHSASGVNEETLQDSVDTAEESENSAPSVEPTETAAETPHKKKRRRRKKKSPTKGENQSLASGETTPESTPETEAPVTEQPPTASEPESLPETVEQKPKKKPVRGSGASRKKTTGLQTATETVAEQPEQLQNTAEADTAPPVAKKRPVRKPSRTTKTSTDKDARSIEVTPTPVEVETATEAPQDAKKKARAPRVKKQQE